MRRVLLLRPLRPERLQAAGREGLRRSPPAALHQQERLLLVLRGQQEVHHLSRGGRWVSVGSEPTAKSGNNVRT